jgi:hypothetical protein
MPAIELAWLPVLCLLGGLIAYVVLSLDDRVQDEPQRPRFALEVGAGAGAWYWLVVRWPGLSQSMGVSAHYGYTRGLLGALVMEAIIWAVPVWPFAAWRMERLLHMPFWRSSDVTTRVCGAVLVAYLLTTAYRLATMGS